MNLSIGEGALPGPANVSCGRGPGRSRLPSLPRGRGQCESCAERFAPARLPSASSAAASRPPPPRQSDKDFLAARAAFERGDRLRLDALAPKLADHVLAPYVEYWQQKLRLDSADRRRDRRVSRPLAEDPARRPAARGLAEGAGQARPVGDLRRLLSAARGRGRRARLLRRPVPPPARRRRGAGGREAALVHRPGDARGLRAAVRRADRQGRPDRRAIAARASVWRPKPATCASRRRSPWTCRPTDRITAREFAHVDASPGPALAQGRIPLEAARAGAISRSTRSSAPRGPTPPASARPGRSSAAGCPKPTGSTGTRGSRSMRRASRIRSPPSGIREAGNAALSDAQRAWRVRAALRAGAWPDVLAAIEAMPPSEAAGIRVALLEGARARRPRAARPTRRRSTRASPARSASTACCRRRRSASGRRSRARRSSPMPQALAAFGATRRRAPRGEARAARHAAGIAARMALRRARAARRGAAAGGGVRPPRGPLRPRDQHRRTDVVAARFRPALPDAVPRAVRGRRAGARGRRGAPVRHRAPGVALRPGHRVLGRRGGVDAADAADGAMGREAAESRRLSVRRRSPMPGSTRSSARTISSTGSTGSIGCRRSRPPRTMPVPAARRRGAPARRSRAPSGSKRFRSTRPATT